LPDQPDQGAQIPYWAFLGFALSEQSLPTVKQQAVTDELPRMATRQLHQSA
jgi:hypothetical protein